MKILLLFLISIPAFARVIESDIDGLGFEQLMSGVGQARVGSNGSLNSNPALLAWLARKKEFISTNIISLTKVDSANGTSADFEPEVIPRYASTTKGWGNSGYAYGIDVDNSKYSIGGNVGNTSFSGVTQEQKIKFNFGYGRKISQSTAFGFSTYLGRFADDSQGTYTGESGGDNFLLSRKENEKIWLLGGALGGAHTFSDWAIGYSAKFNLLKFGQSSENDSTIMVSSYPLPIREIDHSKSRTKIIPVLGAGIQKKFNQSKLFFDLNYTPAYRDFDLEEGQSQPQQFTVLFGHESPFLKKGIKIYSGIKYNTPNKNDEALRNAGGGKLSLGLSKTGKHSVNYAGISWVRPISKPNFESFGFIFGTKFQY